MLSRLRIAAVFVAGAVFTVFGYQSSPVNRPWPPGVQKVSEESPALSPADELKTFYMPPGYHVELVAAEPLVQDPIAMDWDADGRLWVLEFPEYVRNLELPEPNLDPIGRVVVLEDTNHDGRMDKRTVFVDGLIQGRSIKVLDHGVLVLEPPDVWLMRDTNGDLKMDTKELVTTGFGRRDAGVEGNANGFYWGLDNWLHSAGGATISLRLKDGRWDKQTTLARGEWGVAQDDAGHTFRNSSESAIHVDLVDTPYFARNPNLTRTRGSYEPMTNDTANINDVWPVRPNPGNNRAYQFGIDRPDGTLAQFTAACTPLVYRGDRLPAELYGNIFVGEPSANFVSRIIVSDDGKSLRANKAYAQEHAEFLASTDERFRPVFLSNAPDGTMYIVDFYRGIIQDRASTTVYLRDRAIKLHLETPIDQGRIFRVMHDTTRRDEPPTLSKATSTQLVDTLSHPNGWRADTAQRLLVERGDKSVVPSLKTLAQTAKEPRVRLHALWTLDGNDDIDVPLVTKALEDSSRDVRVSAIRLSERWLGTAGHPIQAAIMKRLDDVDWEVQEQLAASLGMLPAGPRETALAAVLSKHADDPVVMDAALSGIRGGELAVLEKLLQTSTAQQPIVETAITMVAATVVRAAQDAAVQTLLTWVSDDARPAWQRSALMRGAEVALLNAAAPGTGRRGIAVSTTTAAVSREGAPCPTCPGGRAGPGGAYAFPEVMARQQGPGRAGAPAGTVVARGAAGGGGGRGGGAGGPRLRLSHEPAAFSALAAKGGDLGPRATTLLARVEWPGKPGVTALAALTPEEQKRYEAGSEVYKNICQACHQPDGRGQDRLAANLIGSTLALAPAEVTARILLNGKEGPIGLMPPLGMTFTDEQVADVLTYIRREWGQPGTPVDPATVKAVRAQTASRTRPWTNEELLALIPADARQ